MNWDHDSLWQKSKVFMERALDEDRDGDPFPFWAALGLEILGRATLAKVHPALLADPTDGGNLLHAFGFRTKGRPKSVMASTVFKRCNAIVEGFTENDSEFAMSMIDRRNEELHTGAPAFSDYPTRLWQSDFFRICDLLTKFQKKDLEELFGKDEAVAARKMIAEVEQEVLGKVKKAIAEAAAAHNKLDQPLREERTRVGLDRAKRSVLAHPKVVECPACKTKAGVLSGEVVRLTDPKLVDDEIEQTQIVLPLRLQCFTCDLKIDGHTSLKAAELGGQYTLEQRYAPQDYYELDFDAADLYEPEYGND